MKMVDAARAYALKLQGKYEHLFGIQEVRMSPTLYVVAWLLLLGWYVQFNSWDKVSNLTVNAVQEGKHLCWWFFQTCGEWYALTAPPIGNTHGLAYAILFAGLIAAGVALAYRRVALAHALFLVFFVWEITTMLLSMQLSLNYWYFHVLYAALFLFGTGKLTSLRIGAVLLYVLSAVPKFNDGWFLGTYFTSLETGLYFFPDPLIPVLTNAVIFMEVVVVWFLLSEDVRVRYSALGILFLFHVYSAVFVGFLYPTIVLPMVLALFLSNETSMHPYRWVRDGRVGVCMLAVFVLLHMVPYLIPGPSRFTHEGNKVGMYMFEANYQCDSDALVVRRDGTERLLTYRSRSANHRCDPYVQWFQLSQLCKKDLLISRIPWTFDTSVNGSPFYRIVDVPDACTIEYMPFQRNDWIRIPGRDPVEVRGFPEKNYYHGPGIHEETAT